MPKVKRDEELRTWGDEAASRAGVGARPEKSLVLEGWGGRIPGFQFSESGHSKISGERQQPALNGPL
jgi:hypothetical protein